MKIAESKKLCIIHMKNHDNIMGDVKMKIKKYPHSCILIEAQGKKILFDPGDINFKKEYIEEWKKVDAIFITHRHGDHCYAKVIKDLNVPIYSTKEVSCRYPELNVMIVKNGDTVKLDNINIEVVNAVHGYLPAMKNDSIKENVGYILDDGVKRVYISSDTMCFENDYKADIACIAVSGHVSMTEYEAGLAAKAMGASLLIPVHMESPNHPVQLDKIMDTLNKLGVNYKILNNGEELKVYE